MKYRALIYENTRFTQPHQIEDILSSNGFTWIIDAELENALLEIKDDTLIWHAGTWMYGTWEYGIFEDGLIKSCQWNGGVFKNGKFESGIWNSGVFLNGVFSGVWKAGEFKGGIKGKDVAINESVDKEPKVYYHETKETVNSTSRTKYTVPRFSDINNKRGSDINFN